MDHDGATQHPTRQCILALHAREDVSQMPLTVLAALLEVSVRHAHYHRAVLEARKLLDRH